MRRSRRILLGVLGVVLISIVAISFWALVLFNPTNHRDRISDWIQTRTGVEMVFEGPIVLDVGFPSDAFLGLSVGIQSATIRSISGVMPSQPMTINRFSVAFSLEDLQRVLRGEGIRAEGIFDVAEIDVRTLTTDLAIDWSIFLPQAFRHAQGKGRFEINDDRIRLFDLDLMLSSTPIKGWTMMDSWRTEPEIAFDLQIPALETSNMVPLETQSFMDGLVLVNLPAFSLASLNATGHLAINQLRSGGMRMTEVKIPIRSKAGSVVSSPITAQLYGGSARIDSIMQVSSEGVSLGSVQRLEKIAVGDALEDLDVTDVVESEADLEIVLSFSGADLESGLEALRGTIVVDGKPGRIKGIDVERLIEQLVEQSSNTGDWQGEGASTPINGLIATARIENGAVTNRDLALRVANLDTRGYGRYDFVSEQINYRLFLSLQDSEVAKSLPPPLNSGLLVLPLQVSGTRQSPAATIDMTTFLQMQFNHMMGGPSPIKPPAKDPDVLRFAEQLRADISARIKAAATQ